MSSRRRRSDDFTNSIVEYHRSAQERQDSDSNDTWALSLKDLAPGKKIINVKSNKTISPDTTIHDKVTALRSQVNSQKQDLVQDLNNLKTSTNNSEKVMLKETPDSPITDVLNKISKALEIKHDEKEIESSVQVCRPEQKKLWNALSTFNRTLSSDKNGVQSHQKVLSRLSQEFHSSPTKFAEKLVTIIEESVMPSSSEQKECSGISLSRMTSEFRKLCKFIEDESMPDWVMSPDVIPEEQIENQSIELVEESSLEESQIEKFSSTPLDKCDKNTYRDTPKGIFKFKDSPLSSDKKPINRVMRDWRFNDTNNSFEYWEIMCNGVYKHQRVTPQELRRSISLPDSPITRLNKIRTTCDRQMASLDDTLIEQNHTDYKLRSLQDVTKEITANLESLKAETSTPRNKKYFTEENAELMKIKKTERHEGNKIALKKRAILLKSPESVVNYSPDYGDDLNKSLLAELAQRRQRCFETAKLMMEIDKNDPIVSDGKETAELISKLGSPNKCLTLPDNNVDFLNTINHCMEYQDFLLKKRKSIFSIIQHPKSTDTDSRVAKESNLKIKRPLEKYHDKSVEKVFSKTPVSNIVRSEEKKEKKSPRRRFFCTPGKSPKNEEIKKKKEYFPHMENILNVQTTLNFCKSPRTPEIRKNIYENVRSPVAEYIKGTDVKLVRNIQAKTNDWLLTPQPLGISSESSENRITPLKSIQESSALKFNLSPMNKKIANSLALGDENIPQTEFKLPKIDYKSPAKVHTIKGNFDNEVKKSPGLRVKTLLKSAEKKIVIRHEGRVAVGSPRIANEDETDDKLVDTSIHVKTIARKTDSIRTRNVR